MQKNCLNDLQRATTTNICTIHALVQELSHLQHYSWCEQVILQDYLGGSSVVRGVLSMATILGPGRPSMAATLGLGRPILRRLICRDHQWHGTMWNQNFTNLLSFEITFQAQINACMVIGNSGLMVWALVSWWWVPWFNSYLAGAVVVSF